MKRIITKIKHQVCYVKIIDIVNSRDYIKISEKISNFLLYYQDNINFLKIQFEVNFLLKKKKRWGGICRIFQHAPHSPEVGRGRYLLGQDVNQIFKISLFVNTFILILYPRYGS